MWFVFFFFLFLLTTSISAEVQDFSSTQLLSDKSIFITVFSQSEEH